MEKTLAGNPKALAKEPSKTLCKWGPCEDLQKPGMSSALGGSAQPLSGNVKKAGAEARPRDTAAAIFAPPLSVRSPYFLAAIMWAAVRHHTLPTSKDGLH